jgi:hypothetical protein
VAEAEIHSCSLAARLKPSPFKNLRRPGPTSQRRWSDGPPVACGWGPLGFAQSSPPAAPPTRTSPVSGGAVAECRPLKGTQSKCRLLFPTLRCGACLCRRGATLVHLRPWLTWWSTSCPLFASKTEKSPPNSNSSRPEHSAFQVPPAYFPSHPREHASASSDTGPASIQTPPPSDQKV